MTPEAYAEFIRQVDLKQIWLASARVENVHGPQSPGADGALHISTSAEWSKIDGGFRTRYQTDVELAVDATVLAEVQVEFGLDFTSQAEMTDALFEIFKEVNLPVNTWPYVREFLSTTMGRMNWVPFTLPALKRGTEGPGGDQTASDAEPERAAARPERKRPATAAGRASKTATK